MGGKAWVELSFGFPYLQCVLFCKWLDVIGVAVFDLGSTRPGSTTWMARQMFKSTI